MASTAQRSKKKRSKTASKKKARSGKGSSHAARRAPAAKRSGNAYEKLTSELREIATLSSVLATISWDQEALMPAKGASLRADQIGLLSTMIHERSTSAQMGDMLRSAQRYATSNGDAKMKANIREAKRDYEKARKLPSDLVAELARSASLGMDAWKDARAESNFKKFLPWLTQSVELARQKADCYGVPRGGERYDALLDDYEPDMTAREVESIFTPLREQIVPLVSHVRRSKRKPDPKKIRIALPIEQQKQFVHEIAGAIGFDLEGGRIDESTHPFCEGVGPGDTRFTCRYTRHGWAEALLTAMHEAGHGIYEQGLPKHKLFGQPLAEAISLGIHESQSRMYENFIGRSQAFWEFALPVARKVFGAGSMRGVTPAHVYRAVNIVKPWWIRVESDECTYNLHIMLRFDLERAMVAGDLNPKDLPGAWNERMKSDFGLTVKDDRLGCLQDVHWSAGLIGYFPTYSLGNIYCAQFWEAMGKDIRGRDSKMARGDYDQILDWLRKNVHTKGRQYSAKDLCKRVTGKELSSAALVRHLKKKVADVYG